MEMSLEARVTELENKIKELTGEKAVKISKKLGIGDIFKVADLEWKILDITEHGYVCIAEKLPDNMTFGSNNDWKSSKIRKYLNGEFYKKLVAEIGECNIIEFERDLLSLDGQTEYGTCKDFVSIISLDEYRKYRALLPNEKYYWWTLTPDSTKCNDDSSWIRVVCPSGGIDGHYYGYYYGVRPFCIFSSVIFESEDK